MGAFTPESAAKAASNYLSTSSSSKSISNYYIDGTRLSQDVSANQLGKLIRSITEQEQRRVRTYSGTWG